MEYVGFIYTKWEKINTDFLPFGSSIYGNICFDNVLLCLDFYITHIAFSFSVPLIDFLLVIEQACRQPPIQAFFLFVLKIPFHRWLAVCLPPFFSLVLPGDFFPVPSFIFSTFSPPSTTSSMFRLINSSTSDSL